MAILQSSLVEPLLSRQQSAVIRDIARAAQLNEALMLLEKIGSSMTSEATADASPHSHRDLVQKYLKAEINRVLMQIKIPANSSGNSSADTNDPGKTKVRSSP